MAIFLPQAAPYFCVICGDACPEKWEFQTRRAIPPICRHCEGLWGNRTGANGTTDERIVNQIKAISEVISATAYCYQNGHEAPHGRT